MERGRGKREETEQKERKVKGEKLEIKARDEKGDNGKGEEEKEKRGMAFKLGGEKLRLPFVALRGDGRC